MIRNLQSVRAVHMQLQNKENNLDKENVAAGLRTPAPRSVAFKTPMGTGMAKKSVVIHVDKENDTPAKVGKSALAAVKTPAARVQHNALQGKSLNMSTLKEATKKQVHLNVPSKTPATTAKRPFLMEKAINTPFRLSALPQTPLNNSAKSTVQTPYKSFDSQKALERSTKMKSVEHIRSKKSSSKKSISKRIVEGDRVSNEIAGGTSASITDEFDDCEIEYMPPSTFEDKYIPDPELTIDLDWLAKPMLDHYVSADIYEALHDDTLLELDPPDLSVPESFYQNVLPDLGDIPDFDLGEEDPPALPFPEVMAPEVVAKK